jgi:hypothetical protein
MTASLDLTTLMSPIREFIAAEVARQVGSAAADPAFALRDRLWSGPATLRLSARELALALGCSQRQVGRYVARGMPTRTRDGVRVFVVGEVREWLMTNERCERPLLRRVG